MVNWLMNGAFVCFPTSKKRAKSNTKNTRKSIELGFEFIRILKSMLTFQAERLSNNYCLTNNVHGLDVGGKLKH